jgi:hypothetical protein
MNKKINSLILMLFLLNLILPNAQAAEQTEYVIDQDFIDLINQLSFLIFIVILLLIIFIIILVLICIYLAFMSKKYMIEIQSIIRMNSGFSSQSGYYHDQHYQKNYQQKR